MFLQFVPLSRSRTPIVMISSIFATLDQVLWAGLRLPPSFWSLCKMKTPVTIILVFLITLLGCRKAGPQADGPSDKDGAIQVLTEITFQVDDPKNKSEGPSPYVNLADPEKDLKQMRNAEEVVFKGTELIVILDYPLREEFSFSVRASSSAGFTRAELVRKVADLYKKVYEEEAQTSKIAVIPLDQRKGLINRNETDGKYGIWGHDLSDLDLHTIEISRGASGAVLAHLGIDS